MSKQITALNLRDPMPLPCPFCGIPPTYYYGEYRGIKEHYLQCDNHDCDTLTQTKYCESYERAVKAWGVRTPVEASHAD
jgi:hypothetical protein